MCEPSLGPKQDTAFHIESMVGASVEANIARGVVGLSLSRIANRVKVSNDLSRSGVGSEEQWLELISSTWRPFGSNNIQ